MAIKISKTFLLRKLHQITGIVPLGGFFFIHLFTNSKALNGEHVYEKAVQDIHDMPYLLMTEIVVIFIPLLFHSIYGVIISAEARPNTINYSYARNWFYLFQRITGIFLFGFILFHVLNFRFGLIPGLNMTPVAGNADQAFNIVAAEFSMPIIFAIYVLGVAATAWHLGYGIWLFLADWGIVIGEKAQKYALYACIAIAFGLFAAGVNSMAAFIRPCGLLPQALCEAPAHRSVAPAKQKTF